MSRKIARITQDKKLLLGDGVVENNTKIGLSDNGRLDVDEIMEYPPELEGGRNLVLNSKNGFVDNWGSWDWTTVSNVDSNVNGIDTTVIQVGVRTNRENSYHNTIHRNIPGFEVGQYYTLSCLARMSSNSTRDVGTIGLYINRYELIKISKEWTLIHITNKVTSTSNTIHIRVDFDELNDDKYEIALIKLEKGTTPTPWTPAPEDLGLNYPNNIQSFGLNINDNNNIVTSEFIEGYPFVKPVIDDSLVLWLDGSTGNNYEQTGTWKDLSGNGNHGELVNFAYDEGSGWVDGGLKSDGVDDYVKLTSHLLVVGSVEVVATIPEVNELLYSNNYIFDFRPSANSYFNFISNGNCQIANLSKLYVNGVQARFINSSFPKNELIHMVFILQEKEVIDSAFFFTRYSISSRQLKSTCSGIKFYNRALTEEEILQNYQAGQCSPLLAMRGDIIG